MNNYHSFYINGKWVAPASGATIDIINPATEEVCATISAGNEEDVDRAVLAAKKAFDIYAFSSRKDRLDILNNMIDAYDNYYDDLAQAVTQEMGSPISLSVKAQVAMGKNHLVKARDILKNYAFESVRESNVIIREPIGVCGLITPWNWPLNQIMCKVAPAIAAGCCMVLKPSEISPLSAYIVSKIIHESGVPAGVFNLVNGTGPVVGAALCSHPGVDMVSFTGSKAAGIDVAMKCASGIKRVCQELGGKSPNIILDDCDLEETVMRGTMELLKNSGQSCIAPSRMLVPADVMDKAADIAVKTALSVRVGDPRREETDLGPVSNKVQFDKIQRYIKLGIEEGAKLICGGTGRPEGCGQGYYVKPTVFSHVNNRMRIAREEIFGPVLVIIPYDTDEEAIKIANDSPYGLAGYVQGEDQARVKKVASRLRVGSIRINGATVDASGPFGGYKTSGNGREHGVFGLEEYLELKAIFTT